MNDGKHSNSPRASATIFVAGVVIGGVGGGIAGWLLGGHIAPLLTGIINLMSGKDSKRPSVRFEALQQ